MYVMSPNITVDLSVCLLIKMEYNRNNSETIKQIEIEVENSFAQTLVL